MLGWVVLMNKFNTEEKEILEAFEKGTLKRSENVVQEASPLVCATCATKVAPPALAIAQVWAFQNNNLASH